MTFREMNLRVFRREPIDHVLFQPRFEPYVAWNRMFGSLPEPYTAMPVEAIYDGLGCSMRYVHYYTGQPNPVVAEYAPEVRITEETHGDERVRTYHTPAGELFERSHFTVDKTWRKVGFPVGTADDLRRLAWLYRHTTYRFSPANFAAGDRYIGDRGVPQFWVPKSPYLNLALEWMAFDDFIFALADIPGVVEETMAAIDDSFDQLYRELAASGTVQIVNFGENVHEQHTSPDYFARYQVPWYAKRAGELRAAGIFSHIHIDGYFRHLLPTLATLPVDGIEALTPRPQGDMELAEIKEHCGDKILLDLIPAVLFMTTYPRERLLGCVEQIVALFAPNLILGVSDEVPEGAGPEGLERTRMIADWARCHANTPGTPA